MNFYPKLEEVKVLNKHVLLLLFSNNEKKTYDFEPNLNHSFYKELRNISLFKAVTVNDGEIEWATGQDFCPHTLYEKSEAYYEGE